MDFIFFIVSLGERGVRRGLKLLQRLARFSGPFVPQR